MKLKEEVWKKEMREVNVRVSDEVHGCDSCKLVIDFNQKDVEYLEMTIHAHKDNEYKRLVFCSWRCVLKYIPKIKCDYIKCDYFVSMPYLEFDTKYKGVGAKDLIKLIKQTPL